MLLLYFTVLLGQRQGSFSEGDGQFKNVKKKTPIRVREMNLKSEVMMDTKAQATH